jgi:hypothetical protein
MDVGTGETFYCELISKTYEYDVPHAFKRLFWWGLTIATSGNSTVRAIIPNSSSNPIWNDWAGLTWDDLLDTPWGAEGDVTYETVVLPDKGGYARKFYKLNRSFRFLRTYFTISTGALNNPVADSAVRIYDITTFIKQGNKAVDRVT